MRSKFELKVKEYFESKDIEFEYEPFRLKYVVPETSKTYTPDFVFPNGLIIEVKGNFNAKERAKIAHIIRANPDRNIRMLFMRDNWCTKTKRMRYSDWCEKHGIKYAVFPKIPPSWFV